MNIHDPRIRHYLEVWYINPCIHADCFFVDPSKLVIVPPHLNGTWCIGEHSDIFTGLDGSLVKAEWNDVCSKFDENTPELFTPTRSRFMTKLIMIWRILTSRE